MGRSRWILGLASAMLVCTAAYGAAGQEAGDVLVIVSSGAEAYELALENLSRELKTAGLEVRVARTGHDSRDPVRTGIQPFRAIAALGPDALFQTVQIRPDVPVIAGMVLRSTVTGFKERVGGIKAAALVDVPFDVLVDHLRRVYPRVARLGVIRNPRRADPEPRELELIGRQFGLKVAAADASVPRDLLAVFSDLMHRADAIICFPDASLYNSATIGALVSASLRSKVPIIGFSEGFVRAGALFSVYPDYEIVGRQTAIALLAVLAGRNDRQEWSVQKFKVAVNARVARLVDFRVDARAERGLLLIQ